MHVYGSKMSIPVLFLRHCSVGSGPTVLDVPEKGSAGRGRNKQTEDRVRMASSDYCRKKPWVYYSQSFHTPVKAEGIRLP